MKSCWDGGWTMETIEKFEGRTMETIEKFEGWTMEAIEKFEKAEELNKLFWKDNNDHRLHKGGDMPAWLARKKSTRTGDALWEREDKPDPTVEFDLDTEKPAAAVRDDGGKMKWHLLPVPALLALCKVFHGGAIKYAEDQWRGGMKFSRIYRSMISHFMKWLASESSYDKELGTHHLMMVAWGCFVLYMYEVMYKYAKLDDRPEKGMLRDEDFEWIMKTIENKIVNQKVQDEFDAK